MLLSSPSSSKSSESKASTLRTSSRLSKDTDACDDDDDDDDIPIVLLHGTCDEDIPCTFSERLFQELCAKNTNNNNNNNNKNVRLHLVAGGDHRLSDDHHLDLISRHLDDIVRQVVFRRRQRRH